jgi:hypothetical protein
MKLRTSSDSNKTGTGGASFNDEDVQIFTPKEFVAGFIAHPKGTNAIEAAWHAAAVALETERIRFVQHEADGGIYFLAADAADFVTHPNAMTPLAAAIPGAAGHQGDGAYLVELGNGLFAVVVKGPLSLSCYIGEKPEAMKFAEGLELHFPIHCELWTGYRQYESRSARKFAKGVVFFGMALTVIFLGMSIAASAGAEFFSHRKDAAINSIRNAQQSTVAQFSTQFPDSYADYRKLTISIVALGGRLIRFEANDGVSTWEAEFPSWVSDLSSLGAGIKTRIENSHVIVSKGV